MLKSIFSVFLGSFVNDGRDTTISLDFKWGIFKISWYFLNFLRDFCLLAEIR